MINKQPHSELEKSLFESVDSKTPDYIKKNKLVDLGNKNEFTFRLTKENLEPYNEQTNPNGLNLKDWFKGYAKEAEVSTAGIRGPQNILYPHDTRFPINLIGIMLATEAKALVAKELYPDNEIIKLAGCEVRYNSQEFLELIARIQAAHGIKTLVPVDRKTIPIWMASFLAFKLDLLGGEYITSSHGISVKNATKDLNSQGSQYLPEESMLFVDKIKYIFDEVEKNGYYDIKIAANDNPLISQTEMKSINDGVKLYKQYLLDGVAKDANLNLIKNSDDKIVIENVGGSAYATLSRILKELGIEDKYVWMNKEEDPFFHSIGKYDTDPKGNKTFYDYSVDATVLSKDKDGKPYFPVIKSLHYDEKLKNCPIGTAVLITDPDHDRLTVCQIESDDKIQYLKSLGIDYVALDKGRILTVFTANQSFLMIMDFWMQQLKNEGLFENHPRFMIKTTASARSWDEWAKKNNIKVVNVPVGFKEIANVMKKVEKQIMDNPDKEVVVTDVLGNNINLGVNPKLIFGGEESGGMIIGSEELIKSLSGRAAIAMREKSATEAIIVASALAAYLKKQGSSMSEYLDNVFKNNEIISKFDIREDISYYNESEPDIEKLKQAKVAGEAQRTKNDVFYLTMAVAKKAGKMTLEQIREILSDTFKDLNFDNLTDVKFVGDGTYLEFDDKFIEIRPSGTDAKTKAYGAGASKEEIKKFAQKMGNYSGDLTDLYKKYVDMNLYDNAKELSLKDYAVFTNKDANNDKFVIPDYSKTLQF
ncbi:phosphomannomutase [Clostridium sp. CAG:306]|nr:phosphomannomutase [Clostridium sp. CAG:306]